MPSLPPGMVQWEKRQPRYVGCRYRSLVMAHQRGGDSSTMFTVDLHSDELPPFLREEITALDRDFAHLPPDRRQQVILGHLSDEAQRCLDQLVADRITGDLPQHG